MLRYENKRPIRGLVQFVRTKSFSLNVMSPTSNCNSTGAMGDSNYPLTTLIWNSGGGLSLSTVCGANIQILGQSGSGMTLDRAPVSMKPSHQCLTPRNPL